MPRNPSPDEVHNQIQELEGRTMEDLRDNWTLQPVNDED
jgi:hypothetical protein